MVERQGLMVDVGASSVKKEYGEQLGWVLGWCLRLREVSW
jgi:hypothetical protein